LTVYYLLPPMTQSNSYNIPRHVALILDGNRRWAKENGVSSLKGHYRGRETARKAAEAFFDRGVEAVSLYAFSSENWNRKKEEVDYLMKLLRTTIEEEMDKISQKKYRILVSGRWQELPGKLPDKCRELMEKSKEYTRGTINFCLNYGGRQEIVDAVRGMLRDGFSKEQITEEELSEYLYNSEEIPEPDVIARTSGEKRLSGYQLWRSAYSEFIFLDKYWPDFGEEDVDYIISEYSRRKRRFGK